MRTIWLMAMKDLRVVGHDKMGLFFIVGFPVLMGVLFGLISKSMSDGGGHVQLEVAVVDADGSAVSQRFVQALEDSGSITIRKPASGATPDAQRESAINDIRKGKLLAFIGLPTGFGDTAGIMWMEGPAIEVGVDPARAAETGMLHGIIMQAMGEIIADRLADPRSMMPMIEQSRQDIVNNPDLNPAARGVLGGFMNTLDTFIGSLDELNTGLDQAGEKTNRPKMQLANIRNVDVTASVKNDDVTTRIRSAWDISFPSAILWGVLGCAASFAVTMVRERSQGTYCRLRVAPISRAQIIAGKGLACFMAVIGVNVFMVALGYALGMRPGNLFYLGMGIVSMALCVVGIMMLMSVIGRTEEAVAGASWGANVVMAMFGGGMIPLAFMPTFMKTLSNFSPMKWGVLALEGAIWRGFSFTEMLYPCAILIAVGAVGITGGVIVLNRATE